MELSEAIRRVKAFIENREIIGDREEYEQSLSMLKEAGIDTVRWMPSREATAEDLRNRRMS